MSALTIAILGALVGSVASGGLAWTAQRRSARRRAYNAVRAAARELYRELPQAAERLVMIDQAQTYGELRTALPELPGWPPIRQRLAENALECVWEPLSYQVGKLESERRFVNEHSDDELLPEDKRRSAHFEVSESLRGVSAVLAGILPSEKQSEIAQMLPPLEKHLDLTYVIHREAAKAGYH